MNGGNEMARYKPKELLDRRRVGARPRDGSEATPGGLRRKLAATAIYELYVETLLPRIYQGGWQASIGQRTYLVLAGALWVREAGGPASRLLRGQTFTSHPDRAFEVGTGNEGASVLVVQPPGFDAALERVAGPREASPRPDVTALDKAEPRPRAQGSFVERTARANAAQGISRAQPFPGRAQTAGEVAFGFTVQGTNLAPVVPEP
jgi:hypothetical protein